MLLGRSSSSVIGGVCGVIVNEELAIVAIFSTAGMVRATAPLSVTIDVPARHTFVRWRHSSMVRSASFLPLFSLR